MSLVGLLLSPAMGAQQASDYLRGTARIVRTVNGVSDGSGYLRVYAGARGPYAGHVVLVPSLGRGVEDFTERFGSSLTRRLTEQGYCVLQLQPRGIGQSEPGLPARNQSLAVLAQDIAESLDYIGASHAHMVGHAFGNRVVRAYATQFPHRTNSVVLLAAGGQKPLDSVQADTLKGIFSASSPDQRLPLVAKAFFAEGNDATVWIDGWYALAAQAQMRAALNPDVDFRRAGARPVLIVQPEKDFIAPAADAGRFLKRELAAQATYHEVANSGHALLPEQPERVAALVLDFLNAQHTAARDAQPLMRCAPNATLDTQQ